MSNNNDDTEDVFVYMGEGSVVPDDVVRIRIHSSVSIIPRRVFSKCKSLKQIHLPSSITMIQMGAFFGCNLEDVELCQGLIEIGIIAFSGCLKLKHIHLPSTVKKIGECHTCRECCI